MNFGVNQKQITTIIKLLSMELENVNMMKAITETIESDMDKKVLSKSTTILT